MRVDDGSLPGTAQINVNVFCEAYSGQRYRVLNVRLLERLTRRPLTVLGRKQPTCLIFGVGRL